VRTLIGIALAPLLLLGLGFAHGNSPALGSIRGDYSRRAQMENLLFCLAFASSFTAP
jgi:hypothetical protein